jgi:hypothetical protein
MYRDARTTKHNNQNNFNNLATQTVSFSITKIFGLDSEPIHSFTIKIHLNVINTISVFQPCTKKILRALLWSPLELLGVHTISTSLFVYRNNYGEKSLTNLPFTARHVIYATHLCTIQIWIFRNVTSCSLADRNTRFYKKGQGSGFLRNAGAYQPGYTVSCHRKLQPTRTQLQFQMHDPNTRYSTRHFSFTDII